MPMLWWEEGDKKLSYVFKNKKVYKRDGIDAFLEETVWYYFSTSVHLKSGLIRGVTFSESELIKRFLLYTQIELLLHRQYK
jgi:hypothetical protein